MNRIIKFYPAWDKRNPDPNKNYGIHGVEMKWFLEKDNKVIQFVVYTNWQLPHVYNSLNCRPNYCPNKPFAADLGYHSPYPMYEGQTLMTNDCKWTKGKCYYDGSGLYAEKVLNILITKGGEAVWEEMEKAWHSRFDIKEIETE